MNEKEFLQEVKDTAIKLIRKKDVFEDIISEINGGKMIRPRTIFALGTSFDNVDIKRLIPLATSTELVHLASLFHDDVIDNAIIRRDHPTLNARYGNLISILAGDYFYSAASRLVLENYDQEIPKIYSHSVSYMTLMELRQASLRWDISLSKEDYFDIIRGKTGSLFSASFESIALILSRAQSERLHLKEAGMLLGEIFQLTDDLLDFAASGTGKSRLKDLSEGDITLPAIMLIKKSPELRDLISRYFSSRGKEKDLLIEIWDAFKNHKDISDSINSIIERYKTEIKTHLGFVGNFSIDRFMPIVDTISSRKK